MFSADLILFLCFVVHFVSDFLVCFVNLQQLPFQYYSYKYRIRKYVNRLLVLQELYYST